MKLSLATSDMNVAFNTLKENYKIFAPVKKDFKRTMSDTASIRYEEVNCISEIEFNEKSQFSAKEVMLPITQVLFYFTEEAYTVPKVKDEKILVFLRACDIHALDRLDEMYLNNGPEDMYYKQIRDRISFALIGCESSFRNCFCVSMDTNKSDDYAIGVKPVNGEYLLDVKDETMKTLLKDTNSKAVDFEMDFVTENDTKVIVPKNLDGLKLVNHEVWKEYDTRCINCGKCNFVCPTCSCFAMQDIFYRDNENTGERRRVWSSCHVDGYTDMAGGHSFRKKNGERMRFKTLHKVHDYNKRFNKHMCIGCGRCDDACPSYISFSSCVNKLSDLEKEGL